MKHLTISFDNSVPRVFVIVYQQTKIQLIE